MGWRGRGRLRRPGRRCPRARLSSAHAEPAQPLAPWLPRHRDATATAVTDQAAGRALPASGLVAADGPDQPANGVADLQWRIGEAVSAAFPDRVWVCGEVVGTPAVRGGAGIAFTLAESRGSMVLTLPAWLRPP